MLDSNFKLNVIPSKTFVFSPVLNYRMERNNIDNNQVDHMKKVDAAFEAGAFGAYNINDFMLELEVLTDVSAEHGGTLFKATAGYRWQAMLELMITPTVFTTYAMVITWLHILASMPATEAAAPCRITRPIVA